MPKVNMPELGIEFDLQEIDNLIAMFNHPGYAIFRRITDRIKEIDTDTAMTSANTPQQWANVQGEYRLIKQLDNLPANAEQIREAVSEK